MNVVFFGTPEFALQSFEACLKNSNLLAVVSQPDKATGRGKKVKATPVKQAALDNNIKIFQPRSLVKQSSELEEFKAFLKDNSIDLFVVTAYGKILSQKLLDIPKLGAVNVHASLLPKWRGAAPVQRSLEAGEKTTGVCLQKMVFKLDAGDVLLAKEFNTPSDMGAIKLFEKLSKLGGELLCDFLNKHSKETPLCGKAQDNDQVTIAKIIHRDEGYWRPNWSADKLHNKIRAFEAWPFVKAKLQVSTDTPLIKPFKLVKSSLCAEKSTLEAGTIELKSKKVYLHAEGNNCLELLSIQAPGKAATPAYNYFQNLKAKSGQESFSLIQIEA